MNAAGACNIRSSKSSCGCHCPLASTLFASKGRKRKKKKLQPRWKGLWDPGCTADLRCWPLESGGFGRKVVPLATTTPQVTEEQPPTIGTEGGSGKTGRGQWDKGAMRENDLREPVGMGKERTYSLLSRRLSP